MSASWAIVSAIPKFSLVVDPGKNKVNVGDKVFIAGQYILSESDLNERFAAVGKNEVGDWADGDWGDIYLEPEGAGFGAINYYGKDKDGKNLYSINAKKTVEVERTINKNYNKTIYGQAAYSKSAGSLDESFESFKLEKMDKANLLSILICVQW